jgi:C-methyltransferase-like protein
MWILRDEMWLESIESYEGLQGRVERIRTRLRDEVFKAVMREGRICGYGAPAKATTLLNFCGLDDYQIAFVVDSTPAKQGRYIPGTGIQIRGEDAVLTPTVLLLAWNYASSIMRKNPHVEHWIVPIPSPGVL